MSFNENKKSLHQFYMTDGFIYLFIFFCETKILMQHSMFRGCIEIRCMQKRNFQNRGVSMALLIFHFGSRWK
jgi:hypothetical protein